MLEDIAAVGICRVD